MAGDTLRDAFRAKLDAILAANPSIAWAQIDTLNTGIRPDASTGYFELEFPGGSEQQYTFGAPGNNLYLEQGQVTLRAVVRQNAGKTERDKAESYIETIRAAFRTAHSFAAGSRTVRITSTGAMGGGQDEAGMWAESIALSYEVFNTG
jgi:hypothetical protein